MADHRTGVGNVQDETVPSVGEMALFSSESLTMRAITSPTFLVLYRLELLTKYRWDPNMLPQDEHNRGTVFFFLFFS